MQQPGDQRSVPDTRGARYHQTSDAGDASGANRSVTPPAALALHQAYRDGKKPTEVVEACLEAAHAAEAAEPALCAIAALCGSEARRDAAESERRYATGTARSALEGVPVLIKDNIDVAGLATTHGTTHRFAPCSRDATSVARLRAAGAVIVGKTNLHQLALGITGINPHRGTTRNPHDPARWCGGSSSGSASAVAAGLAPLALGTDAGGSVRIPAAMVGIPGLKPSFARVSRAGLPRIVESVDHVGPMARSCLDLALCLAAIAGEDEADPHTMGTPAPAGFERVLQRKHGAALVGLRVGFARHLLEHRWLDPAIGSCLAELAQLLEEAGAAIVDVDVPDLEASLAAGSILNLAEGTDGLDAVFGARRGRFAADAEVLLAVAARLRANDYVGAQRARAELSRCWLDLMSTVDVLLMPATGMVAGRIKKDTLSTGELDEALLSRVMGFTMPSNLSGLPALVLPYGVVNGMPASAQLVAPMWEDARLLEVGIAIERMSAPAPQPKLFYGV